MSYKYTLSQATDKYFINSGVDKKKFFAKHLIWAGDVWSELYIDTLNVMKSKWLPLKRKGSLLYVNLPDDCERICSLNTEDSCGSPVPLYFNRNFQVVAKPTAKCECACAGLAEEMNETVATTRLVFTEAGVDYYEKKWITLCKNGDVIEYRELPVKKFNDRRGDSADYNDDFNNDFAIGNPFANFEIVTETLSEKKCNLAVKECGCPLNTVENEQLIMDYCGSYLNPALRCGVKRCDTFLPEINPKHRGEAVVSDCETKMFVRKLRTPTDYLLFTYQSNGRCDFSANIVPEKALMALHLGIDYRKKFLNNAYSRGEKMEAKFAYQDAINSLITFDNKLTLEFLNDIPNTPVRW